MVLMMMVALGVHDGVLIYAPDSTPNDTAVEFAVLVERPCRKKRGPDTYVTAQKDVSENSKSILRMDSENLGPVKQIPHLWSNWNEYLRIRHDSVSHRNRSMPMGQSMRECEGMRLRSMTVSAV
jgi:hypothetical protein